MTAHRRFFGFFHAKSLKMIVHAHKCMAFLGVFGFIFKKNFFLLIGRQLFIYSVFRLCFGFAPILSDRVNFKIHTKTKARLGALTSQFASDCCQDSGRHVITESERMKSVFHFLHFLSLLLKLQF